MLGGIEGRVGPLFGGFKLLVDPWEVDYGDQTRIAPPAEEGGEGPHERVDHEVECGEGAWEAIAPCEAPPRRRVLFIDGVRRLEARVHARQGERLIYGAFGSLAVGAVALEDGRARFDAARVSRLAVLGGGVRLPGPVVVRPNLIYTPESAESAEADGPLRRIQDLMRLAEAELAAELVRPDTLVIVDGPLSFERERKGLALGYVKRVHELYLPPRFLPLIATLPATRRTPLFLIQGQKGGRARYSWFQRLAAPPPGLTDMHGIVRLEVAASVGLEVARQLADTATVLLPRTAPGRARDPRSPQNLLPIGALEQQLRVGMGDARLFRRWIEDLVAREALHGVP